MDDLDVIVTELFRKYFHVLWEAATELAHKTWLALWGALYDAAVWLEAFVGAVAARVSLWQAVGMAVVAVAGLCFWIFRENFYVRRFRHNIHWLRFRGYRPMLVDYRLGAKSGRADFLGRETAVPERFPGLRIFDAIPDAYVVVFGTGNGGPARMVRTYPRQTRAGRAAMVRELSDHVREAGRYVNPRSEVEAFLAFLAAMDPAMADLGRPGEGEKRQAV
ncbi:hypothetical protein G3N56_14190 [Desulfovibrio sulfodismutans]|uniref:Uncharacterized protein n=1 Tax=Desulfolutivibrio sulfodismutans TaxID=63561 RepID=A0A7K3NNV8_9BACT|nr:hypothetical protein [Desulfolutivibrio sulfodismutans]NDY57882.1 hypothetical protein [Desulfolutivibrio sulfodismutans]QLA11801.1 hypothetical protein GD606_05760 [Desulfolutivibrio sulfodismutans DSM 3696]